MANAPSRRSSESRSPYSSRTFSSPALHGTSAVSWEILGQHSRLPPPRHVEGWQAGAPGANVRMLIRCCCIAIVAARAAAPASGVLMLRDRRGRPDITGFPPFSQTHLVCRPGSHTQCKNAGPLVDYYSSEGSPLLNGGSSKPAVGAASLSWGVPRCAL